MEATTFIMDVNILKTKIKETLSEFIEKTDVVPVVEIIVRETPNKAGMIRSVIVNVKVQL